MSPVVGHKYVCIQAVTLLCGLVILTRSSASCDGKSGGEWTEGMCTVDSTGQRSPACKACLVGAEWDALRQALGTEKLRGKRGDPIRLALPNWTSGTMLASAFRIMAEEILGYDVTTVAYSGGMTPAASEAAADTCKAIFTEVWGSDAELRSIMATLEEEGSPGALQASFLGAQGHETIFAPDYLPFISTHYRSLAENIVQVMPDGHHQAAMDSFAMDGSLTPENLTAAGLSGPDYACTPEATADWTESQCVEGRWYPPRCGTEYPSPHCAELYIPSITWSSGVFESAIYRNGLNFSIVYTGDGASQTDVIARMHKEKKGVLYYWWEPDPFLVKFPSVRLILPEQSMSCTGKHHPDPLISTSDCDTGKTFLRKFIHSSFSDTQPDLYHLWNSFQFSTEIINELMSYSVSGGGDFNLEDATCKFLKNSTSFDWRSWLRIENRCSFMGPRWSWDEQLQECTQAMECGPGTFYNANKDTCELCEPGHFTNSSGLKECYRCDPGQYCRGKGCIACLPCPADFFQEESGAATCSQCPASTHTFSLEGADSREACTCKEGTYRRDGLPGLECFPCPDGAQCDGGIHPPFASQGFWGDWSLVDLEVPDSDIAAAEIKHSAFLRCRARDHCLSCDEETDLPLEEGIESEIKGSPAGLFRECRSDPNNICSQGYQGVMCQACVDGYFSIEGDCFECPKDGTLFTLGCLLALFAVWFVANSVMASQYDAVDLLLIYFQNASTISTFILGWSEFLKKVPFRILGVVNFDVTYISFDCLYSSGSQGGFGKYGQNLLLQLMLPLVILFINMAIYLAAKLKLMWKRSNATLAPFNESSSPKYGARRIRKVGSAKSSISSRPEQSDEEWLEEVKGKCISASSAFVNLVIHTVTFKCLETLSCTSLPDGSSFLTADPDVPCWGSQHIVFVVLALLGLSFYSLFIPAMWMRVMRKAMADNRLRDPVFKQRWGWLYLRYERDWYYWEILIVGRRCLLVALAVLASEHPSIQIVGGLAVCVTALTMHCYAHPFIDRAMDDMETVSLVSLMVFLGTGILFSDATGPEMYPAWERVVTGLALASLLGCLVMAVVLVTHNIQEAESKKTICRKARKSISSILAPSTRRDASFILKTMNTVRKLSHMVLTPMSGSKVLPDDEIENPEATTRSKLRDWMANDEEVDEDPLLTSLLQEDLELPETFETHQLKQWIANYTMLCEGDQDSNDKYTGASDVEKFSGNNCKLGMIRFWLVNHWLSSVMSDTSPVSYYSSNAGASFFHSLVSNNMYLIDHLLYCTGDRFLAARDAIKHFVVTHFHLGSDGRLAKMLTTKDQGAFLAWLLVAEREQIDTVRELMVDIYMASNDGRHPYEDIPNSHQAVESEPNSKKPSTIDLKTAEQPKAERKNSRSKLAGATKKIIGDAGCGKESKEEEIEAEHGSECVQMRSNSSELLLAASAERARKGHAEPSQDSSVSRLAWVVSMARKPYAILNSIAETSPSEVTERMRSLMADLSS